MQTKHSISKKRKIVYGLNVGSSSILLVFVVLCLVCFATLSIVSANADHKLSTKLLERTTAYYNACNEAETNLAAIDSTLASVYADSDNEETYFATVGHNKSYAIPFSDLQTLQVSIQILYPETNDGPFYQITCWQVVHSGELE